jgi:hypothetical protein
MSGPEDGGPHHQHRTKRRGASSRPYRYHRAAHAPGVRPGGADPARRGRDREPSESRQGSVVLTDLLTTVLDHHGRRGIEKPREQDS